MSMGVGVKRCPTCNGVGWLKIAPASDDDEPITPWNVHDSPRGGNERASWALHWYDDKGVVLFTRNGNEKRDLCVNVPLPHIRTRGDLRRLLAALGWSREG